MLEDTQCTNLREINQHIKHWGVTNQLQIDCIAAGKYDAEIAIIGNYVHDREKVLNMPFSGNLGELVWNALRIEKITRSDVYQTIAIKKYKATIDPKKPVTCSKEEIDSYGAILRWELTQLPNLKYIVVFGDFALKCLLTLPNSFDCQGSVYTYRVRDLITTSNNNVKLLCCIDPDTVLKQPKFRGTLAHNFQKLTRLLKGEFIEPHIHVHYNKPVEFVINYIRQLMRDKLPVALDIEVVNMETACIGLTNKIDEALCINFRDEYGNFYSPQDELRIRLMLQAWFDRKDEYAPKLVMQNGMFDSYWLGYKDRLHLPPSTYDTMLASHTLASTLPHNLGYLTSKYTDMPYYKDEGKTWKEIKDYPQFWNYNGKDCCATLAVYYKQKDELIKEGLYDFFTNHVMRLQPHLIRMTVGGVLADRELKDKLAVDIAKDIELLKTQFYAYIHELTGDAEYRPNPASPKQLAELFFTRLRLVGRGDATDAKNRARMIAHHKTPEAARKMLLTLNTWAKEQKFYSTYLGMKVDEDNRIRCEYKQTGVQSAPGRLSSTSTMWESGANLQNQPARAHELFLIDEGYEASYFDLSQAEARVVGWRYCIHKWIEQFEKARLEGGYDAHRALAAEMYHIPYDKVPKEDIDDSGKPTIRYIAKRCRHGLNYTMQGALLAEQIGVTANEGQVLYDIYHRVNPELRIGWEWTEKKFLKEGALFNAYGRRYLNLEMHPDLGNLVAFYFQSTIGDKVARCIYQIESDPEWPSTARMILNIHDALIAIHKQGDGELCRRIMKKYAEEPIQIECIDGQTRELIIPADFKKSVPYKIIIHEGEKIKVPDLHRWSNLEKVKML